VGYEVTASGVSAELKRLAAGDDLTIRLNSFGGDVFDGLTIYQRVKEHKGRVTVMIDGIAASIASVIAMAGDEIVIAEHGEIMIHDAWTVAAGNASDLRSVADRLEAASTQIAGIYQRRTGRDMEQVRAWMASDFYFGADAAVANGFADRVMGGERMAAKADLTRPHFRNEAVRRLVERPAYAAAASKVTLMRMRRK
jgi:ATP-dependent Clp endopeptidase proteolytic subunit ClpP